MTNGDEAAGSLRASVANLDYPLREKPLWVAVASEKDAAILSLNPIRIFVLCLRLALNTRAAFYHGLPWKQFLPELRHMCNRTKQASGGAASGAGECSWLACFKSTGEKLVPSGFRLGLQLKPSSPLDSEPLATSTRPATFGLEPGKPTYSACCDD